MKKTMLFLSLFFYSFALHASLVQENDAKQIAENFLNRKGAELFYCHNNLKGNPLFYVFNFEEPKSFVMVSANRAAKPILSYSKENQFRLPQQQTEQRIQLFIEGLGNALDSLFAVADTKNTPHAKLWDDLLDRPNDIITRSIISVSPLLTVKWGQDLGHYAARVGNSPSGCVATAVAQVMHYYKFPERGWGTKTLEGPNHNALTVDFGNTVFEWDKMSDDSRSDEQVWNLLYHVGIALSSFYSPTETASATNIIIGPLRKYFGYESTMRYFDIGELMPVMYPEYSDEYPRKMLLEQLNKKQPVILSIFGNLGGHAIVCDGYDADQDLFHLNWGWSGSNDGFYNINDLQEWFLLGMTCDIRPDVNYVPYTTPFELQKILNPGFAYPCGAGTDMPVAFADFNRDGTVDLINKKTIYYNQAGVIGNNSKGIFSGDVFEWADRLDVGDYDGDGNYDLISTSLKSNSGNFSRIVSLLDGADSQFVINKELIEKPDEGAPELNGYFVDFTGDGHLDIITSYKCWDNATSKYKIETTGFVNKNNVFTKVDHLSQLEIFDWWDIDDDGKMEAAALYLDGYTLKVGFYSITENDATLVKSVFIDNSCSDPLIFKFIDVDNDGICELISGKHSYEDGCRLWKLNGDRWEKIFDFPLYNTANAWHTNGSYWYANLSLVDFNADGFMDVVLIWHRHPSYGYGIEYYENKQGKGFVLVGEDTFDWTNAPNSAWADFNGDGYVDFATPGCFYVNTLGDGVYRKNKHAKYPEEVNVENADGHLSISWDMGSDDMTPQNALSYNLRVGTTSGAGDIVSPGKMPGVGNMIFRRTKTIKGIEDGKYYVQVQSIDHSGEAGEWSPTESAVITTSNGLDFKEKDIVMRPNQQKQLEFELMDLSRSSRSNEINWTSSNPNIVRVNQEGVIEALAEGYSVITATSTDGDQLRKGTCVVTVSLSTSIEIAPTTEHGKIFIYPNPAKNYVTIRLSGENSTENITITDLSGKMIHVFPIKAPETKIDITNLETGIYLVKARGNVQKLIITQ